MRGQGVIVKRCGCLEPGTRRRWGRQCPRLSERGHGSWYFRCSVTTFAGRRERVRRSGYSSRRAAVAALAHEAGADLKTVQEQLGHTSIVLTADTYTKRAARPALHGRRSHRPAGPRGRRPSPRPPPSSATRAGGVRFGFEPARYGPVGGRCLHFLHFGG
jgi:hypothetical protein